MAIFRGTGGSGNSTDDSIVDAVTEQAGIATTKASEAATSATNAASSASAASSSATTAATKATEATTAKTDAETAETNAQTAQSAAETARDQAQTSATSAATSANTANSAAVQTVAGSNTQVVGVYNNIGSVNTVAGDITNVNTVAGISSDVTTVAADASDIGTVSSNIGNVNNVGNNISNVNSVAGNASNINTVASDGTDIGTVAGNISNVNTVAGISSNVTTVAGLETKMDTVIADASDIGTVAGNINDVSAVAGISSDVTSVADNSSNINSVASNMTAVQGASTNATNAATSASNASDSASAASTSASTASTKATEAASSATSASNSATTATTKASQASTSASTATTKASEAAASATSASSSATTATTKANEAAASATAASGSATTASTKATEAAASAALFTNLTAATGAAGSDANYNNATGVLTVPRGDTGAQGPQGNNGSLTVDTVSGDLSFADNGKAKFGAGNDLQIYHSGTNSHVKDVGTGSLLLQGDSLYLMNAAGNYTYFYGSSSNGAAQLRYGNSPKLATTSTGVDVTGTVTADGLTVQTAQGDVEIPNSASMIDMKRAGTNYIYASNSSGNLRLGSGGNFNRLNIANNGDISFYEDTGTTAKLFWDASAEDLQIGGNLLNLSGVSSGTTGARLSANGNGLLRLASGGVDALYIKDGGNVGIGTSAPAAKLDVSGGTTYPAFKTSRDGGSAASQGYTTFGHSAIGYSGGTGADTYIVSEHGYGFAVNGGTTALAITDTGQVGIGTSSPAAKLDVQNSGLGASISGYSVASSSSRVASGSLRLGNGNGSTGFLLDYYDGGQTVATIRNQYVASTTSELSIESPHITFNTGLSYSEAMRIDPSGNVGIATSNPTAPLHVNGTIKGSILSVQSELFLGSSSMGKLHQSGSNWVFDTYASGAFGERFRITDTGASVTGSLGIGTTSPSSAIHATTATAGYTAKFINTNGASDANGLLIQAGTQSTEYALNVTNTAGNTSFMAVKGNGNVGIGTTAPEHALHIYDAGSNNAGTMKIGGSASSLGLEIAYSQAGNTSGSIYANPTYTNDGAVLKIGVDGDRNPNQLVLDGVGNVGIGVAAPNKTLTVAKPQVANTAVEVLRLTGTGTYSSSGSSGAGAGLSFGQYHDSYPNWNVAQIEGIRWGNSWGGALVFRTNNNTAESNSTERMRLTSDGTFLVGKSSSSYSTVGAEFRADGNTILGRANGNPLNLNRTSSDGDILQLRKDNTVIGSIGVTGSSMYIQGSPATGKSGLTFYGSYIEPRDNGAAADAAIDLGISSARFKDLYMSGNIQMGGNLDVVGQIAAYNNSSSSWGSMNFRASDHIFKNAGGTERARIDTAGNFLLGQTSATPHTNYTSAGSAYMGNGQIRTAAYDMSAIELNRTHSDGDIAVFRKQGTTVGSIGSASGEVFIGSGDTTLRFFAAGDAVLPRGTGGGQRDGIISLGAGSNRFDDVYATNGTIQTSDRNDKQDIAELSDAEQRVAIAAKGLLRKFRWKSAVEEKGDEARTHFGIIAQDLQDAFTAEGLDAGDYAMFINTTWTDEETGEERSRMGVRYSELLAFIISAI